MYDITDASSRSTDLVNDRSNIGTWIQNTDSDLSSLSNNRNTIKSSGFDLEAQKLTVAQRENEYANYFVRAPFDGTIGKLDLMMSDSISSGSSIGTLVTNQKLAEITLNEVDISKVKVGQKATLTFDAIEDFSLTGTVAEVDMVGTVSSGVVSYGVKVGFDTQDSRVLPGMSVTVNIATDVKQDVLVVPNSAIKTTNGVSTVSLVPQNTTATEDGDNAGVALNGSTTPQVVEVGVSDDTNTEILSGLKEGDKVITKTIQSSTGSASAPSIFSAFGVGNRSGSIRTTTSGSNNARSNTRSSGGNPAGGPPIGG
jgi:HlyD family secretion protein